uniref:Uncharacterized protein n=1 Tax=Panagrolaimus superbus TaxID=310955 RepID=A0A914XXX9_9BILA
MGVCTTNMAQFKDDDEFWTCRLESSLDPELMKDSLQILCNISPKKHIRTIEKLSCLQDESNGMKMHICEKLESQIEVSPLLVIEWIEAFKLYTFKSENLRSLTLSSLVNNLDITKYLMTNDSFKDSILSLLDEYVVTDRPKLPQIN